MKLAVFFFIVLLVEWSNHSTITMKEICVRPVLHVGSSETSSSLSKCVEWSVLLQNTSKYFMSYRKLRFLPGDYDLDKCLVIENVTNLTITEYDATKPGVTIHCVAINATTCLSISSSTFVSIQNVKLQNSNTGHFFSGENAVILLHNVTSMIIFNITIQNSHGYGIIGINLMGNPVLLNITIFHISQGRNNLNTTNVGGLALRYSDHIKYNHAHNLIQNIVIKNFMLRGIQEMNKISISTAAYNSTAIEIAFHQFNPSINVTMVNVSISNLVWRSGPLVSITYCSSTKNFVSIHNSSFTRNEITINPIIYVAIEPSHGDYSVQTSLAYFELSYSRLDSNTASAMCIVTQPNKKLLIPLKFKVSSSVFANNTFAKAFWSITFMINVIPHSILIQNCKFISNIIFKLEYYNVNNLTLTSGNYFYNNSVNYSDPGKRKLHAILRCDSKTNLTFRGYNEFAYNTANVILRVQKYAFIGKSSIVNISYNKPLEETNDAVIALVHYFRKQYSFHFCLFQFLSSKEGSLDEGFMHNKTDVSLIFDHNKGYRSIIHESRLNTCSWEKRGAFQLLTPGDVYKKVLNVDVHIENVISRRSTTFCVCEGEAHTDCIRDHFGPIFPGQTIPISLKQILPPNEAISFTAIHKRSFIFSLHSIPYTNVQCLLILDQTFESKWIQQIGTKCTPLSYKVYSASNDYASCFASLSSIGADDSTYIYYIDFKPCPIGFEMYNGSCECNKYLKAVFPNLVCDIETQTIMRPRRSWIGLSSNKDKILYVKRCIAIFCEKSSTAIQMETYDTQCKSNRVGINCGQCPPGLSTTFGFYACKRCSNYWLLLLIIFMFAGIFLVLSLFTLNLTVVDGKLYGFVVYANLVAGNSFDVFPSKNNIFFILLSLFNLDLGIELCFYDGMTEYVKTWLQFAFPLYLLFIVATLSFASRYSSLVERLTRRRVISVIATVFLLAYSKLLLVTARVLFSYTTVYTLPENQSNAIWTWDSSVPLFGIKFSTLFAVCLLLFSCVLLPFNLLMLFTKFAYRFRIISMHIKPYLDAYQAPFKNNCSYFLGIELILRPMYFAIGNRILDAYKTLAVNILIFMLFMIYLCTIKPFKTTANTVLYISYILNAGSLVLLVTYFDYDVEATSYIVLYNILLFTALAEFGMIALYYFYINCLYRVKTISKVGEAIARLILYCKSSIKGSKHEGRINVVQLEPLANYEQYQEELLAVEAYN